MCWSMLVHSRRHMHSMLLMFFFFFFFFARFYFAFIICVEHWSCDEENSTPKRDEREREKKKRKLKLNERTICSRVTWNQNVVKLTTNERQMTAAIDRLCGLSMCARPMMMMTTIWDDSQFFFFSLFLFFIHNDTATATREKNWWKIVVCRFVLSIVIGTNLLFASSFFSSIFLLVEMCVGSCENWGRKDVIGYGL